MSSEEQLRNRCDVPSEAWTGSEQRERHCSPGLFPKNTQIVNSTPFLMATWAPLGQLLAGSLLLVRSMGNPGLSPAPSLPGWFCPDFPGSGAEPGSILAQAVHEQKRRIQQAPGFHRLTLAHGSRRILLPCTLLAGSRAGFQRNSGYSQQIPQPELPRVSVSQMFVVVVFFTTEVSLWLGFCCVLPGFGLFPC